MIDAPQQRKTSTMPLESTLPAMVGGGAWFVGLVLLPVDMLDATLLFAPLVLVPLGLRLIARDVSVHFPERDMACTGG